MKSIRLAAPSQALLVAGLLAAALGAHAASGYVIEAPQEAAIHEGMTMSEVKTAIGAPYRDVKYISEPGETWTYQVAGTEHGAVFDVDFSADGKVLSVLERVDSPR